MKLKEEITHKDLGPMMDSFVSFASEKLGIKTLPNLQYKPADPDFTSFGGYSPSGKSISIVTKGRHPMDIFRTVAHELVHCKQDEDGRIKDVAKEGETGSDIENEANALAGQIMRWYAKANPDKFSLSHMVEETEVNEDLRKWFKEKWVRYDTEGNIKGPCAREEGEGKPKCRPLASARAMSKEERAKSARRKRREDPVADRKGKGGKPIMVATEEYLMEKNIPTNPELWSKAKSLAKQKFDVYPSAYANGWAAKWYKSKGGGWKSSVDESFEKRFGELNEAMRGTKGKPGGAANEARRAIAKKNMKKILASSRKTGKKALADRPLETGQAEATKNARALAIVKQNQVSRSEEVANLIRRAEKINQKRFGGFHDKILSALAQAELSGNHEIIKSLQHAHSVGTRGAANSAHSSNDIEALENIIRLTRPHGHVNQDDLKNLYNDLSHRRNANLFDETLREKGPNEAMNLLGDKIPHYSVIYNHALNSIKNSKSNLHLPGNINLISPKSPGFIKKLVNKIRGKSPDMNSFDAHEEALERVRRLMVGKGGENPYDVLREQVDENLPCNREEGTDSVVWNYASHTPGQMEFLKTMSRHLAQGQYDPGDIPAPESDKTDKRLNEEDNPPSEKELEELRKMFGGKRPSEAELKEWKKSFKIKPTNTGSTSVNEEGLGVGPTVRDKGPASYPMGGIGESCGKPHRKSVKQILDEIQEYGSMGTVAKQTSPVMENVDKDAMQCNKPRTQAHGSGETGKSHIVKACAGGKEKIIRFGQLGVKGSPKKEGESEEYANRRKRFKARHGKNIKKGKMSAAYWADKVKW